MLPWHLYLMSSIYIIAGIIHFLKPKMYIKVMPDYIPDHKTMVLLSGLFEIVFGLLLLFKTTRFIAINGIVAMLLVFLSVHIEMLKSKHNFNIPNWLLWIRIPLQFALIAWAMYYL